MSKYPGITFQEYRFDLALRLTRHIAAILISIGSACLISLPCYAVEHSSSKQSALEQEIAARLMRGEEVASLAKQIPPRTTPAARYQSDDTARGVDHQLASLHHHLQTISRKGGMNAEDVAPLQASYDEFKANHLLLTAQFASVRTHLEKSGTGSDIRQRLESTENSYNVHVAKILALEESLQQIKSSTDQPALLKNAAFRKKSLSTIRAALDAPCP